ncbi:MAG: 3-beta hydroxysteroid dehydrogenase [Candidatus Synechococcus spongiarum SP3]|uniref:3-beta hydroxysteroid dehydrogenase n=1 Tax=Candidatus Synechococcus spongiarum SP3 TaxID=1604020 RepID=A0A0G2IWA9_9SYNE|nr:MAG: 3-beta hydroxysteroid dehydrogenase [Candidatus Synechococcus spongiarum SP3]
MKVLIVGATGTLGRQVVRRCLDQGHDVRCLVRIPRKAGFLQGWGGELAQGDLLQADSLDRALDGCDAVIDAATTRVDSEQSVYAVDWDGKLNLFRRMEAAGIQRLVFHSILKASEYRTVPLMDIKCCTEDLLRRSGFQTTILQVSGFMQGLISQFAIPVLDRQNVWVSGSSSIAYMNSQDVARFAVAALERPETIGASLPAVGPKAWTSTEVIQLCEALTQKEARVLKVSPFIIKVLRTVVSMFEAGLNVDDRLAFAEVSSSGTCLDAPMEESYRTFGLNPADTTTLETYLKEYYDTIIRRLRQMQADLSKEDRKRLPF